MLCSFQFRLTFVPCFHYAYHISCFMLFGIGFSFSVWIYHLRSKQRGTYFTFFERSDMDQRVVTVDQLTITMASIQEALANLRQQIDSRQSRQLIVQDETPYDSLPPYLLHGHSEVASPVVVQTTILEDMHAWIILSSKSGS